MEAEKKIINENRLQLLFSIDDNGNPFKNSFLEWGKEISPDEKEVLIKKLKPSNSVYEKLGFDSEKIFFCSEKNEVRSKYFTIIGKELKNIFSSNTQKTTTQSTDKPTGFFNNFFSIFY